MADLRTRDAIKVLLSLSKLEDDTDNAAAAALESELKTLTKEGANPK